jgi:hypothetical protein
VAICGDGKGTTSVGTSRSEMAIRSATESTAFIVAALLPTGMEDTTDECTLAQLKLARSHGAGPTRFFDASVTALAPTQAWCRLAIWGSTKITAKFVAATAWRVVVPELDVQAIVWTTGVQFCV